MFSIVKNFKYYFLGVLFFGAVFFWYSVFAETTSGLKVAFLDVGQGDAIFVEAPNGNQVLIDGGPNKAVLRELAKQMPFYDRTIDGIVITHPHLDHSFFVYDRKQNIQIKPFVQINPHSPFGKNSFRFFFFQLSCVNIKTFGFRIVVARINFQIYFVIIQNVNKPSVMIQMRMSENNTINSSVVKRHLFCQFAKDRFVRSAIYQNLIAVGRFHKNRVALPHI